jgi:hypothetical protein
MKFFETGIYLMKRYNKKFHKRQEMLAKQQPLNKLGYNQSFELDRFLKLLGRETPNRDDIFHMLVAYMAENDFQIRKHTTSFSVLPKGQNAMGPGWARIDVEDFKVNISGENITREVNLHDPESLDKIIAFCNFIANGGTL